MHQQERPANQKWRFSQDQQRQDQHVSDVETLSGKKNGVFAQRMFGTFQIIVGWEEKTREVPDQHIVEGEQRVNEKSIEVLEPVPWRSRFIGRKAKDAAPGQRIVFAVEIDAGMI